MCTIFVRHPSTYGSGTLRLHFNSIFFIPNYQSFFQPGENRNGDVLILLRYGLQVFKCSCKIPNICIIDLYLKEQVRIFGLYASQSKSWDWSDVNPFILSNCVVLGDYNVDLGEDQAKGGNLLTWADSYLLVPILPDGLTSLRSWRTIDYALFTGVYFTLQAQDEDTTSDQKPLISVLGCEGKERWLGKRTNWIVLSAIKSYVFTF